MILPQVSSDSSVIAIVTRELAQLAFEQHHKTGTRHVSE